MRRPKPVRQARTVQLALVNQLRSPIRHTSNLTVMVSTTAKGDWVIGGDDDDHGGNGDGGGDAGPHLKEHIVIYN